MESFLLKEVLLSGHAWLSVIVAQVFPRKAFQSLGNCKMPVSSGLFFRNPGMKDICLLVCLFGSGLLEPGWEVCRAGVLVTWPNACETSEAKGLLLL